jgi:predicted HTH domain antitoxin
MQADEIAWSMCREFALKSFQSGKLTLVQAATLCGMNIYDFISTASKANIPIIDYGIEEIDRELALLNDNR